MYKSKLHQLCQKQKWAQPSYTYIKDGDDHRPQFKASVFVSGLTFDTPSAANSIKNAHNEAAHLALLHFSTDVRINASCILDKEVSYYRSKLNELCQKRKWRFPKFKCSRDGGEDHCPQFKASVVVNDVSFEIPAASSKKKALNQAARFAFLHLSSSPFVFAKKSGIEVKPAGKPSDDERGRLHVSQATLGAESSIEKGDKKRKREKEGSVLEKQDNEKTPSQIRTFFSNGLAIEELVMGRPDGKIASPGSEVSVHYMCKLMEDGKIVYSNIGGTPFKFRLGCQVIKGWEWEDVCFNGMRVGDKRRLIIPPSMRFWDKVTMQDIPPNAWLVFEVELVGVN